MICDKGCLVICNILTEDERRLNAYSEKIIGAAFEVSNVLGAGFLEKVYENALSLELNLIGLKTIQHKRIVNGIQFR